MEKIRLVQQSDARHITVQTELSGEYIVYDVTGKQIMTGCFGQAYGNPAIVFSPALADGAYIIHFHANDGTEDTKKWRDIGVLAVEMEAAALYTNAILAGKKALAICTISDIVFGDTSQITTAEERETKFVDMMKLALSLA